MGAGLDVEDLGAIDWAPLVDRRAGAGDAAGVAQKVVSAVAAGGDAVLRRYTEKFDGVDLPSPLLGQADWDDGASACPAAVRAAIDGNLARIRAFHERQRPRADSFEVVAGLTLGRRPVPLGAVACYVPGGRASYPSTVMMTVVPATVAGVQRIVVVTPPGPRGVVDPAVLYAAKAAGATEVLRAGGAQAVAALAMGTDAIAPVDAIVGPGNAYVTAAKQAVADRVRIDVPAGPSELLVLADDGANPAWVALDLLAQAEHDPDAQVVLVATSRSLAAAVRRELVARAPSCERAAIIEASLRDHGRILVAANLARAIDFANAYAPEHLTLMLKDPAAALDQITSAGSVFLGPNAPVSLGDYGSGTNHVLPTMGFARQRGGLAVDDFVKWITWQDVTRAGLAAVADDVATLARSEGLVAHAQAIEQRLEEP